MNLSEQVMQVKAQKSRKTKQIKEKEEREGRLETVRVGPRRKRRQLERVKRGFLTLSC